ncbi:uncharacterized protein [Macrobrachium rosenbergii]|uniref:uncharacterized protein isoform X2 n=1 Tax=Macrobrachium rosenbergii TaxID=79674 RepID=UPI0034D6F0C9
MATKNRSEVWLYFEEHEYISAKVVCQICSDTVIHSGNTSNMLKHLKTKHESEYSELENKKKKELEQSETPTTSKTKQMLLLDSFSRIGAGGKYPDQETPRESTSNLQDQQKQDSQEKIAHPKDDEEISSDTARESKPEPSRPSSTCLEISGTAASSLKTPVHMSRNKKKCHLESPKKRLIEKAEKYLDAEEDEFEFFGKFVATRLRKLNDLQRVFAEKQIMEILYNCSLNMVSSSSQFPLANENQRNTGETSHSTNSPGSRQEEHCFSYDSL